MERPSLENFAAGTIALNNGVWPQSPASVGTSPADPVIVVGGGPAGLRVAQEVSRRGQPVVLFNAERWQPYNRVKLTPFLAGEVQIGRVYQAHTFAPGAPVTQYDGQTIVAIDREAKTVENQFGRRWRYSKLVLCLGSRPHIPPIPGRELAGVYRFRNFDDVEQLVARSMRSRRTVVIGGGLLGLEAARGMALRKVATTVIEHEQHLMARQLDGEGGRLLQQSIERMGLSVRTGCSVKAIGGTARVEYITLSTGEQIDCDTVIICTGIRSNIELASEAGLAVGRGVTVGNTLQTTDPDIYAVGECAEHGGHVYGLVAPGLEQATAAAAHLCGEKANYRGSVPTTRLKVVGTDVFSMGDVEQIDQRFDANSIVWTDGTNLYRRLIVRRSRVVGAIGIGEWPELNLVQQAVRDHALLRPWEAWRFRKTGRLRDEGLAISVAQWPAAATVCNCTGVTRGQLGEAVAHGANTIEALMRDTSASTVCGTCRPLLQELIGGPTVAQPAAFGARTIAFASALAALAAVAALLLPAWPASPSAEDGIGIDRLWTDGAIKQVTGFTLVALSALVAFLSIRKRIGWRWLGGYNVWRVLHAAVGTAALAILFLHTGFSLGQNLNRWLMVTFLAVAAAGSLTGLVTAREHVTVAAGRKSRRGTVAFLHILTFWPLPLLLLLHVVTVYAY